MGTTSVSAGGIERSDQSVGVLFQQGRYVEFTASYIQPDVSGVGSNNGVNSGNIGEDFNNVAFAYKDDINKNWSYALIYDEPYGTDVKYPTGTGYFAAGSEGKVVTRALTGILQYNIAEPGSALGGQFSVYGGPRAQYVRASATNPAAGYNITTQAEFGYGYLVGAAWERPDLGMRASLTYTSEIEHSVDTLETGPIGFTGVGAPIIGTRSSETSFLDR
jgi:long-subunit fatty acid transport protein